MWKPGNSIGPYRLEASLKSGGMGALFLARREGAAGFQRFVAIKVIHAHLASDPTFVRMFVDEALLSAKIQHPNVVHVEELGEWEGSYFLAMEYVPGCSLAQLLSALSRAGRRLSPRVAAYIAAQVADGLHAAHETRGDDGALLGVVHRDVSPQNVLLATNGAVKLIDFGVAKARGRSQQTASGSIRGKLRYMPPEQARGDEIDRRADGYALGIVLWEMLTGRRLFDAPNDFALIDRVRNPEIVRPSTWATDVDEELDELVLWALSPRAEDRPATALELRARLAEAVPDALALGATQLAALIRSVFGELAEGPKLPTPSREPAAQPVRAATEEMNTADVIEELTRLTEHGERYDDKQEPEDKLVAMPVSKLVRVEEPRKRAPWRWAVGILALLVLGAGSVVAATRREGAQRAVITPAPTVTAPPTVAPPVFLQTVPIAETTESRDSGVSLTTRSTQRSSATATHTRRDSSRADAATHAPSAAARDPSASSIRAPGPFPTSLGF